MLARDGNAERTIGRHFKTKTDIRGVCLSVCNISDILRILTKMLPSLFTLVKISKITVALKFDCGEGNSSTPSSENEFYRSERLT